MQKIHHYITNAVNAALKKWRERRTVPVSHPPTDHIHVGMTHEPERWSVVPNRADRRHLRPGGEGRYPVRSHRAPRRTGKPSWSA